MLTIGILLIYFWNKKCSADSFFLNRIKKLFGRETKDKNLKGTFKTVIYLGSQAKISCYGQKAPTQAYRELSWYHDNKHVFIKSERYTVDKHGVLTIHNASVEDSGDFTCETKSRDHVHRFKHDVTVLQLPSKSLLVHFMYAVPLCTLENKEFARRFVESKVERKVCLQDECKLGYVRSKCQSQELFSNPALRVTVPVVLPSVPTGSCDVKCSREKVKIMKDEVQQRVISAVMVGQRLKIREEPQEMSVSHLHTDEEDTCRPGFEMKGTRSRSVCVPCQPGHFLEAGGYCIPCHLNQYSGRYGATECHSCFGHRVTRSRGATSEGDCYVSDPTVLWIVFSIILITVPLISICCCWSFTRVAGQSLARGFHCICSSLRLSSRIESKSAKGNKRNQNPKGSSKSTEPPPVTKDNKSGGDALISSIPSARHSTAKDYFYNKGPQTATEILPTIKSLPAGPALEQASRRRTEQAAGDARFSEKDVGEEKKAAFRKNMKNFFPRTSIDPLSRYSDRILKNPAMYNAIKKSVV